jgi:hypothetical protein
LFSFFFLTSQLLRKSWDARRKHARSCVVDPTPTAAATVVRGRIWAPTEEFGYLGIFFWVPTDLLLGTYGLAFGHLRIFIWVPTTYFHLGTYGLEILLPVFRQTGRDHDFPFFLLCMLLHVPPLPIWNFASFGKCSIVSSASQELFFF